MEAEICALKMKASSPTKKMQEMKHQIKKLQTDIDNKEHSYNELTGRYEALEEEHVLIKAQLTSEKENLSSEYNSIKTEVEHFKLLNKTLNNQILEMTTKLSDAQLKLKEANSNQTRNGSLEYERNRLKNSLDEKEREYDHLRNENNMNSEMLLQLRREVSKLINNKINSKLYEIYLFLNTE